MGEESFVSRLKEVYGNRRNKRRHGSPWREQVEAMRTPEGQDFIDGLQGTVPDCNQKARGISRDQQTLRLDGSTATRPLMSELRRHFENLPRRN